MITEDYVSFELAKLLKEKGFDEPCYQKYDDEGYLSFNHVGYINSEKPCDDFYALAPTLQMAMKWLRKVHNLHVEVHYNAFWDYYQYIILYHGEKIESDMAYHSFENAAETVIKFCLKKLI